VRWHDTAAPRLQLSVNLGDDPVAVGAPGRLLHRSDGVVEDADEARLPAWTLAWWRLEPGS